MDKPGKLTIIARKTGEVIWAVAIIGLPLTTFPLLSSITGAQVAPFSILPFAILLACWALPLVIRKGDLARESIPLFFFTLFVILSSAAAFFIDIPGFKGRTIPGQEARALFTLAVGLTFFLVTAMWLKNPDRLKATWRYISLGGIGSLVWTGIQAYYVLSHADQYPVWLEQIQSWFAIISPSFSPKLGRVSGLTYEASWFAHQMVMVYLPVWMAASYLKTSAFKFRLWRITLENILLVVSLVAFFLSSPRIGLISLLLVALYIFMRLNLVIHRKLVAVFSRTALITRKNRSAVNPTVMKLLAGLSIGLIYVIFISGVVLFASQRDWRLALLVSDPPTIKEIAGLLTLDQKTLLDLSHRFIFLERMVYWLNGWNIFNHYPWLGVGLGNAGFFFPKLAPAIGWSTYEIRDVLFHLTQLPNVKSLWFRLLAETGLAGFSIFLSWFYILFKSSLFSQHHPDLNIKTFALAGQLALIAFIGEGFSIDSFAMPYFWVMAGIIAAIAMLSRREANRQTPSN